MKLALLLAFALLLQSRGAWATTSAHQKWISVAGCRSLYNGTTAPFSDYVEYDDYNQLYDYLTISGDPASLSSAVGCDFQLPETTTALTGVVFWYRKTTVTGESTPTVNVVITDIFNSDGAGAYEWQATSQGLCGATLLTSYTDGLRSCTLNPSGSSNMTPSGNYSNFGSYAVITWNRNDCGEPTTQCTSADLVMQLEVDYTTSP